MTIVYVDHNQMTWHSKITNKNKQWAWIKSSYAESKAQQNALRRNVAQLDRVKPAQAFFSSRKYAYNMNEFYEWIFIILKYAGADIRINQ